ncbi:MAG: AgmX/PglI C-terminal domain-containing protein, partial [Candidatus Coatesbacteria bacterium]
MKNVRIGRWPLIILAATLAAAGAAQAQKIYDVDPIPYPITSWGKAADPTGEWAGREEEAKAIVKNYEPPAGEGSLADRLTALASLAKGTDYEVLAVVDWDAEQKNGPYYVVFYEVMTKKGWHDFIFLVDLAKPEIEPITKAARVIWYGDLPEALAAQATVVIRPANEETAALAQAPRTVADVEAVMAKNQKKVVELYKDQLKKAPELAGRVLAAFVVVADGTVVESSVIDSTTDDDAFDAALADLLETFEFPAVDAGDV